MEFRLLGPVEVVVDGVEVPGLGGPKPRALLALLALRAGRVVTVDTLVDALWPDDPPTTAVKTVQTYVVQLRRVLGPALVTRGGGYLLDVRPERVDAHRFERLVGRAEHEARSPAEVVATVEQALALWRGEPMADLVPGGPLEEEARRLVRLCVRAREARARALVDLGRHDQAVDELHALLADHPLQEGLWAKLMVALYRSGRQAEALRAYQDARAHLGEVGLEPGPELVALEQAIVVHDPALAPGTLVAAPAGLAPALILGWARRDRFVGRETERRMIEQAWRAAVAGDERRVVAVAGEPGIGKTRLVAEVAASVVAEGAVVLSGRCDEGGQLPFQPFVEALRPYVAAAPPDVLDAALALGGTGLARLMPELVGRVTPDEATQWAAHGAEPDRYGLFQALVALVSGASARAPVLLVVDDLHWADEGSLLLLRHLVRAATGPLVVVVTFRDTEAGDALAEHLALLAREVTLVRVILSGLGGAEVAELVERCRPGEGRELGRVVHEATGGNPFFVEEMLRDLDESAVAVGPGELAVPAGVREVVERRLARLSPDANRVLEAAAVAVGDFEVGVIAAATGRGDDDVVTALDEAVAARLVAEVADAPDCYRFSHALVRATVAQRLSTSRRARLHRALADALEWLEIKAPGSRVAQLAHHLGQAGPAVEVERVVRASTEAAEQAIAHFAYEDAVHHYQRAVAALERERGADAEEWAELLVRLGEAQMLAGRLDAAKQTFLTAAELARAIPSPALLARVAIASTGRRGGIFPNSEEESLLEEALGALGPEEKGLRAAVLARLAQWRVMLRDDAYLLPATDEALSLAREEGVGDLVINALVARLYVLHMPEHAEEKLKLVDELQALAESRRDHEAALAAERHRVTALMQLGSAQVWAAIDRHEELARRVGMPLPLSFAVAFATARALMAGRFDEAEGMLDGFEELARRSLEPDAARFARLVTVSEIRRLQSRLHELEPTLTALAQELPQAAPFRSALALALAQTGRLDEASRRVDELCGQQLDGLPRNRYWSPTVSHLVSTVAITRQANRAQELYDELLPRRHRTLSPVGGFLGAVDHHLGVLAGVLGRHDDARRHLEAGLEVHERLGARAWVVLSQVALGRVLLDAGQDRERATALVSAALAAAEEFGMGSAAVDARAVLRGTDGPKRTARRA